MPGAPLRIGTAGWSIPRECADAFAGDGTHLQRYARMLNCTEINSSFQRSHRPDTYAKWAAQTPSGFRFAVKVPKLITHQNALRAARGPLQQLRAEVAALGPKLAVLLVQMPASLPYDGRMASRFFGVLADLFDCAVVCEPRHGSWFEAKAQRLLVAARVGRAGVDPEPVPGAGRPGGWLGAQGDGRGALVYHRWHGSPRMYWSRYEEAWLEARAAEATAWPAGAERWCVFDNTASGAATPNALPK